MFEQLKEFGAAYIVAMALVAVIAVIDAVSVIHCLTKHREDLHDYAEVMIKYTKIIVIALMGVYFILQTLDDKILTSVKILHIAVGIIAVADSAVCFYVKRKFSRGNDTKGLM